MEHPGSGSKALDFEAQNEPALKAPARSESEEYAKSSPPPSGTGKTYDPKVLRAERFWLLFAARGLLYTEGLRQKLVRPNKLHATAKCRYITRGSDVGIYMSKEHGSAFLGDLVTCGSVWSCPVCSALIQERRRIEIEQAVNWAYKQGLQPVMVTITSPHRSWQTMQELLVKQAEGLGMLRKGASYDRFKESIGYQGMIRALETKYGDNGWHNHTHEMMFVSKNAIADSSSEEALLMEAKVRGCSVDELRGRPDIKSEILKRWEVACRKVGLLDESKIAAFRKHAIDVKGWCSASDYLAKQDDARHWGIDRELAKANNKTGSRGGRSGLHPFGLLANAAEGDEQAGYRFVEYSLAIRGKAQIFWSRGLKAKVGVVEKTDKEAGDEAQDKADCLGLMNGADWHIVRSIKGAHPGLLVAAETGGWAGVRAYIDSLRPGYAHRMAYREVEAEAKLAAEAEAVKNGLEKPRKPIQVNLRRGNRGPARIDERDSAKSVKFTTEDLDLGF